MTLYRAHYARSMKRASCDTLESFRHRCQGGELPVKQVGLVGKLCSLELLGTEQVREDPAGE